MPESVQALADELPAPVSDAGSGVTGVRVIHVLPRRWSLFYCLTKKQWEEVRVRHKGRLGALLVEMEDGTQFSVGTGFSDAERENAPAVGSLITYRYQELSDGGVPRFPSYVGIREDSQHSPPAKKGEVAVKTAAPGGTRRFEFSEGKSNKFWELSLEGTDVTVRFGRVGTQGQTQTKTFPAEAAAAKHAENLVAEGG